LPTFAFIIIATELQPWKRILKDGQEATWIRDLGVGERYLAVYSDGSLNNTIQDPQDHRRIIFQGDRVEGWNISAPRFIQDNHAQFEAYGGYGGLVPTTISAIEYLRQEFNPDFYIRTNVSSFWNLLELRKLLSALPMTGTYAGVTGPAYSGLSGKLKSTRYVSGAGMIMSRDVASRLVEIGSSIDLTYIDDLTIGRALGKAGIKSQELTRVDLRHKRDVFEIVEEDFLRTYHFRCKSEHRYGISSFRSDVSLMKAIQKRFDSYAAL
jgi:hypothetical protein